MISVNPVNNSQIMKITKQKQRARIIAVMRNIQKSLKKRRINNKYYAKIGSKYVLENF